MSPEHTINESVDGRPDLFSLGVVFYEMLTGCLPLTGTVVLGTTELASGKYFDPISALRRDLPSSLTELVEKALEDDREFRCQSAAEVRAGLKRIQRDLGRFARVPAVAASPASPSHRGGGTGDRRVFRRQRPDWSRDPLGLLDGRAVVDSYSTERPRGLIYCDGIWSHH